MGFLVSFCVRISYWPFVASVGSCLTGTAYWTITSVTLPPLWRDNSPTNPERGAFFQHTTGCALELKELLSRATSSAPHSLCDLPPPPAQTPSPLHLAEMNTLPGRKHLIVSF